MDFELKQALEGLKTELKNGLNTDMDAMQKHLDSLDVRLQSIKGGSGLMGPAKNEFKAFLVKNISHLQKADGVKLETKEMSITGFTGLPPKTYANGIAAVPNQPVDFQQLIRTIQIDTGDYSFIVENPSTGDGFGTPVELATKGEITYNLEMKSLELDFLASFVRVSKKMLMSISIVEQFIYKALTRDYLKAESAKFYSETIAVATASALTTGNRVERLTRDVGALMQLDYAPNVICVSVADYFEILLTAGPSGSSEASYSLPGNVYLSPEGFLQLNGITIFPCSWVAADKYLVMTNEYIHKVANKGLSVKAYEQNGTDVVQNAKVVLAEQYIGLQISRPNSIIYGDFTTVAAAADVVE